MAKDPVVAGLGLAATRDFVSFLKQRGRGRLRQRQSARRARAKRVRVHGLAAGTLPQRLQHCGFNEDERRTAQVFDGILNWIGGGSGVGINYRFAQTARTERNRQNHRYPEAPFPFAYGSR